MTDETLSLEAEQYALGCAIMWGEGCPEVTALSEDHFEDPQSRIIHAALKSLSEQGVTPDTGLVVAEVRAAGKAELVNLTFLDDLLSYLTSLAPLPHHLETLSQYRQKRLALRALRQTAISQAQPDEIENKIAALQAGLADIDAPSHHTGLYEDLAEGVLEDLQKPAAAHCIPTGLSALDEMIHGLFDGELVYLAARPSMGKAQPFDAKVLTPSGYRLMGDIHPGDLVTGADGMPKMVLGTKTHDALPMYRVTMEDGGSTECCDDHLWLTSSRPERKAGLTEMTTKPLREVRTTLKRPEGSRSHAIPWVSPVAYSEVGSPPIHPWLLGMFIGDGSFRSGSPFITNGEPDLIERVVAAAPPADAVSIGVRARTHAKSLRFRKSKRDNGRSYMAKSLNAMGLEGKLSTEKRIPRRYAMARKSVRVALLQGLLDSDGSVISGGSIEYSTSSPGLASDVEGLVRGLGGRVSTTSRIPRFTGADGEKKNGHRSWRMVISFSNDICPVSSEKHLKKYRPIRRKAGRFIDSVEYTGIQPGKCLEVDGGLYVTDDFIVTHNSALARLIARNAAKRGHSVLFASLEVRAKQMLLNDIASEAEINTHVLRAGNLSPQRLARASQAASLLRELPMRVLDTSPLNVAQIRSQCVRAKVAGKLDLLVVDYLQLLDGGGGQNRNAEIEAISRALKSMAGEFEIPVLCLSQLNRSLEHREDKVPRLADLRDSGSIEQDADVVIFLHRPERYDENEDPAKCLAVVAKQRNGIVGRKRIRFVPEHVTFCDWEIPGAPTHEEVHRWKSGRG